MTCAYPSEVSSKRGDASIHSCSSMISTSTIPFLNPVFSMVALTITGTPSWIVLFTSISYPLADTHIDEIEKSLLGCTFIVSVLILFSSLFSFIWLSISAKILTSCLPVLTSCFIHRVTDSLTSRERLLNLVMFPA